MDIKILTLPDTDKSAISLIKSTPVLFITAVYHIVYIPLYTLMEYATNKNRIILLKSSYL